MPLVFSFFLFFQFRVSDWKNYIALKPQQNRTYFKHWASRIHQGGEMWKYLISRCSCQVRVYLSAICFLFHSYFYRMQCSLRLFPRFSGVLLTILKNKNLQRKLWVQGRHARFKNKNDGSEITNPWAKLALSFLFHTRCVWDKYVFVCILNVWI